MMEQGVLGAFIGMLVLVLLNFGRASFVDIPSVLIALAAFIAIYKRSAFHTFCFPAHSSQLPIGVS